MNDLRRQAIDNINERNSQETADAAAYDAEITTEAEDFVNKYFPTTNDQATRDELVNRYKSTKAKASTTQNQLISQNILNGLNKRFGITSTLVDTHGLFNGVANSKTGQIVINSGATKADVIRFSIAHELGHMAETTGVYSDMQKLAINTFFGGDVQRFRDAAVQRGQLYDSVLGEGVANA